MTNRIKAVIFDLDGTLLDTLTDLMNAVNHALHTYGYPERTRDEVRRFVGNGIMKLVERAIPDGTANPDYEAVCAETKRHYAAHCEDNTAPYAGILSMLQALKAAGYLTAVVSNKPDAQVRHLCDVHFSGLMDAAAGAAEGIRLKPAPDTLLRILDELHTAKEAAVYVGDSDVDLLTAQNAGIPCISVLWGFRDRDVLESAGGNRFAQTPHEILQFL
jgi:phosphoglycolate phosphatase